MKYTLLIVGYIIISCSSVFAGFLRVPSGYPTIQAGIDAANNGDQILVGAGTYTGPGNRDIDINGKSISITSEIGPTVTILDFENFPGLTIRNINTGSTTLEGFTFMNGHPDYHGSELKIQDSDSAIIKNCKFIENNSNYSAVNTLNSIVFFEDCVFGDTANDIFVRIELESDVQIVGCTSYGRLNVGSQIATDSSSLSISNSTISGSLSADYGPSLKLDSCLVKGSVMVTGARGELLRSWFDSSSVYNQPNSHLTAVSCEFTNHLRWKASYETSSYSIDSCKIEAGPNSNYFTIGGNGNITNSELVGWQSLNVIGFYDGNIHVSGCEITSCDSIKISSASTIDFSNTRFTQTGIFAGSRSNVVINNCVFDQNPSYAIRCSGAGEEWSSLSMTNSTITNCEVGIGDFTKGALLLDQNIIASNNIGVEVEDSSGILELTCNDIFGNVVNFAGMSDQNGTNGNFSLDPQFCDAEIGDFSISALSPAAASHNSCGVLIGAVGVGCDIMVCDINGDNIPCDISDLTYFVDFLFRSGPEPVSDTATDLDCSGTIDISDLTYLVDYMFRSGPATGGC